MKVFPNKLDPALAKSLAPIYLVAGDEPLTHMEACDSIRAAARREGIDEREVLHVDNNFAWGQVIESANALSLFSSRKLIEVRLGTQSPGQEGARVLTEYAQSTQHDNVLLITAGRLDRKAQQSSWFKALDKVGVFVPVWPVDTQRMGYWIKDRAERHQLELTSEAAQLLAERVEGNLLAADQELVKLALYHPKRTRLDGNAIVDNVEDSARFDVFSLTDACLRGEPTRAVRIVAGLKGEGVEAPVVLWALTRELRTLLSLRQLLDQGQSVEHACKAQKPMIPEKRRPYYQNALARLPHKRLNKLLMFSQRIDQAVKGTHALPLWDGLTDLALTLAGGKGLLAEWPGAYRSA
ncbi:DNA polymerase III subunit delta [Larsenimonas suaedae]|uniref:DNA polymerase III subunit delta n=1 Tax=Larsenimonas suaedae TaxID=1851019 RepID=A0ABU1GUC9_9GAMM|nr:DNA polymerase III subunit delta [Larsenimonas suaedae]MCM2970922.1 DNA polymerase III subunit delta [Larsenimonas suaedae]MDR5895631.1 DNA polymerase III subunit delta [Larsenimonas suaedae]